MHIPDGFLTAEIWGLMWVVTCIVMAVAFRKTTKQLGDKQIPLMGVLAAFIFAAQMVNVPVLGGTSGHFLGGVMAAVFLGPYTASIIMAAVFFVQAILFQDGGLTALGANIFNMGLLGVFIGYCIFIILKKASKNIFISAGVASWFAIMLAATATSLELAASGTSPLALVLPAMLLIHAIVGVIEAAITMGVIGLVMKARPDLLELEKV
ncbi:MAG: energy-coupling factor ABC transporter permease [Candidatus Altiarchaeota archaeon]|nr:energy-coupling factor ABC transporter permease [Candidatus Altiarchaeota archaeon]